ncbi:hypothetical protein [Nocardia jiangxiensis]|uniref:hypothetical protein n=1 Tax=Nocardia jiangxiensis TaxID=282685 RepID=UPI000593D04B|nr:hypothetical protein [Nocardia jiangxiensis]
MRHVYAEGGAHRLFDGGRVDDVDVPSSVCAACVHNIDVTLEAAIENGLIQGPRMVPSVRSTLLDWDNTDTFVYGHIGSTAMPGRGASEQVVLHGQAVLELLRVPQTLTITFEEPESGACELLSKLRERL